MGDFGRYVLTRAVEHVVGDEPTLAGDVERAVFERVLELGWTHDHFKDLDRNRDGGHDGVVERVGKKYQWIALHEVLGRLTDHFPVRPGRGEDTPRPYEHAEQVVWRDIDPTVLVGKPGPSPQPPRFAPVVADFPDAVVDDYPDDTSGLPDPLDLLAVTDPDGTDWLTLVGNHTWNQPLPVEVVAQQVPRLVTWMQLHAYLVPLTQVDELASWARGQDWFGRWMPEYAELHNLLLVAHPDGPEWDAADGLVEWRRGWEAGQPPDLRQCALWYGGTGTGRDASASAETSGFIPTRPVVEMLGLSDGRDFRWQDADGLAVQDPSAAVGLSGPRGPIRRSVGQLNAPQTGFLSGQPRGPGRNHSGHLGMKCARRWPDVSESRWGHRHRSGGLHPEHR
jgi:hypothetical protein